MQPTNYIYNDDVCHRYICIGLANGNQSVCVTMNELIWILIIVFIIIFIILFTIREWIILLYTSAFNYGCYKAEIQPPNWKWLYKLCFIKYDEDDKDGKGKDKV